MPSPPSCLPGVIRFARVPSPSGAIQVSSIRPHCDVINELESALRLRPLLLFVSLAIFRNSPLGYDKCHMSRESDESPAMNNNPPESDSHATSEISLTHFFDV